MRNAYDTAFSDSTLRTRSDWRRRCESAGTAIFLALCASANANGQVVYGLVTERSTSSPIAGVVVSLVDSSNRALASTLTDVDGAYELRAPGAGTFVIEAKRIGTRLYRGASFNIALGERRCAALVLDRVLPIQLLDAVRVTRKGRCVGDPSHAENMVEIWEDARAALRATIVTAAFKDSGTITRFTRVLDPETGRVLKYERSTTRGRIAQPFVSVPVQQLARDGYAVSRSNGMTEYYAPDAEVLLSEIFVADHCFRLVKGAGDRGGMWGLAFEPSSGANKPDVSGVLWLDGQTAELRDIQFKYVGLSIGVSDDRFGGSVSFARWPNGHWFVNRWLIRMPVLGRRDPTYLSVPMGSPLVLSSREVLLGIREQGGTVELDLERGARIASIIGVVFDSSTGMPAAGAEVSVSGTPFSVETHRDGHYTIFDVPPGSYDVSARNAMTDSLGVPLPISVVSVPRSGTAEVNFAIPSYAGLASLMCGSSVDLETRAVIRVLVLDGHEPLRAAPMRVWWTDYSGSLSNKRDGKIDEHINGTIVDLDSAGARTMCALPGGHLINLAAEKNVPFEWTATIRTGKGEVGWRVIHARRP